MWIQSLSREDPLEEGTATHSNILVQKIQGQTSMAATVHEVAESDTTEATQHTAGSTEW